MTWNTRSDTVAVKLAVPDRPFTRRGILSTINSTFDPLGVACPVVLKARLFQRNLLTEHPVKEPSDWDAPISEVGRMEWEQWKQEVTAAAELVIPRCLCPLENVDSLELHAFADASEQAVGGVVYLKARRGDQVHVSFVAACSKLAPQAASTSMSRLDLCGVLQTAEMASSVHTELGSKVDNVRLYTDSMIVLGYLRNESRQFTKYVTRRIEAILKLFPSENWQYVATDKNPADHCTRPMTPAELTASCWLSGPPQLWHELEPTQEGPPAPDTLPETLPTMRVMRTAKAPETHPWIACPVARGTWQRIVTVASATLRAVKVLGDRIRQKRGVSLAPRAFNTGIQIEEVKLSIFQASQRNSYPELFKGDGAIATSAIAELPDNHPLSGLAVEADRGLLRVGGRLREMSSPFHERHPVILNSNCIVAIRFAEYCHATSPHQGRLITMHSIRTAGVFIVSGRRLVDSIIRSCVICKRLRGKTSSQIMADLPTERLSDTAPFEHVGIDVAGPWYVHDGKTTRRTLGTKKVFVLIVNCLASRAVHLEPLGGMDTNSLLNALRRFFAVRGPCTSISSDHGSNFVGAVNVSAEFSEVQKKMETSGITWKLNLVGASHFGGRKSSPGEG